MLALAQLEITFVNITFLTVLISASTAYFLCAVLARAQGLISSLRVVVYLNGSVFAAGRLGGARRGTICGQARCLGERAGGCILGRTYDCTAAVCEQLN